MNGWDAFWMLFGWATFWFVILAITLIPSECKNLKNWWRFPLATITGCLWWLYLPMEAILRSKFMNSVNDDRTHSLFSDPK